MSYIPPYELTKMDIAALRQADYIVAWLNSHGVVGAKFEAVKRAEKTEKSPFATDVRHEIAAPIRTVYDYRDQDAQWACCESVDLYPGQACQASSALATLRAGDAIALEFYPDGKSNDYVRAAGLHGDMFSLHVYRKGMKHATFVLRSSICPDNSARMCRKIARAARLSIA